MATFTGKLFGKVFTAAFNKEIDLDSDTIKAQAHTSTYTPDQDVHDYKDDLTNEVAAAGGYSTGGITLASKTVTYTGATNKWVFDAADIQWPNATFTFRTLVLVDTTPATDATRPLIGYQQGDVDTVGGGGNLDFQWNAAGVIEITVG